MPTIAVGADRFVTGGEHSRREAQADLSAQRLCELADGASFGHDELDYVLDAPMLVPTSSWYTLQGLDRHAGVLRYVITSARHRG